MEEQQEKRDSVTAGTAATGAAVKLYFDFATESEETIDKKITFAVMMAEKAKAFKARHGGN